MPDESRHTVRIRIKRQEDPDASPNWEHFDVAYTPGTGMNITSVLQHIAAYPVTVEGVRTTPVAYNAACLEEVCGSCTMRINGFVSQACSQLVEKVADESGTITLEPMSKFPVVRDLVVDRSRLFEDMKRIHGWVPIDSTFDRGPGPTETPEHQGIRYALSRCMSCGCCLEACPQYQQDNQFVGAAIFNLARLYNMHQTGAHLANERLDVLEEPGGINDCGQAQNCVKVCPKDIPLTESIGDVGRRTTVHAIKKFFRGK